MNDERMAEVLSALGNVNRMRIVRATAQAADGGVSAAEAAAALGLPPNHVSRHLAILVQAGILIRRNHGRSATLTISDECIAEVMGLLRTIRLPE